jgi:hypothetical protein
MKKRLITGLVALSLLLLCACNGVRFESNDYHFNIRFPKEMTVFEPGKTEGNNPHLKEFDITLEDLDAFSKNGGIFYAVQQKDDAFREVTVNVAQTVLSEEIWQLNKDDTKAVEEFTDKIIETFNTGGAEVLQKGKFTQGKAYCVYVNIKSGAADGIDAIYMATIYNGLQYAILYQANTLITEEMTDQAHDLFDTFFITETLSPETEEPKDTTTQKAVLTLILMITLVISVVAIIRIFGTNRRLKEKEKEEQPYIPQFDIITDNKKDKKK